jgi:hypothetical protein
MCNRKRAALVPVLTVIGVTSAWSAPSDADATATRPATSEWRLAHYLPADH